MRALPLLGFVLAMMVPSLAIGCTPDDLQDDPLPMTQVRTDRTYIRDAHGRYAFFHGVNVSGSNKVPAHVDPQTGVPTYVGKPFPLEIADRELRRLADKGFNSIRLLVIWEGVEPECRGKYDEEYLAYIRRVVEIAHDNGIYVLMDFHQDMFTRHLSVKYNENPAYGDPGSLEATLTSLVPPYTDEVKGDGAPRWAVEACLPEKKLSSPNWGIPRLLSGLGPAERAKLILLSQKLSGSGSTEVPDWITYVSDNARSDFPVNETTDMLPFTNWPVTAALSVDVERMYGCIFAGDVLFPGLEAEGINIKDYLQEAYANAWRVVAERVADMPNVIGYDIMNEPQGNFIILTALAGAMSLGMHDGARQSLIDLMGDETGSLMYEVIAALRLMPPDTEPETLRRWGLDKVDAFAALGLNMGFDRNYVRPFYSRVAKQIQAVDSDAVIWIEPSVNFSALFGLGDSIGGMWDKSMTRPEGINQLVFAPHVYADIYPNIGFDQPPRDLSVGEIQHRDYTAKMEAALSLSHHALGNVPVVFGEFGTYFNFNGIKKSIEDDYIVSEHMLDNYYEGFEGLFQSSMLWCYSPENDYQYGDLWNKEDFSIIDPNDQPRGERAWSRPFARFTAGKPISTHFYSNLHYFDPDKGQPIPVGEFEVRYMSKETNAPTEIFIPKIHYPAGFYVWVSDGRCYYDHRARVLYHYPAVDEPEAEHWVRVSPPLPGEENEGWDYFFDGPHVVKH